MVSSVAHLGQELKLLLLTTKYVHSDDPLPVIGLLKP